MAEQITSNALFALLDSRPPVPTLGGPTQGVVVGTGVGGVKVALPNFHPDWAFGPCRYSKPPDSPGSTPPVVVGFPPLGTRCLIVLDEAETPWIVAFDRWPA